MAGDTTASLFFYRAVGGAEHGPVTIEQMGRSIAEKRVTAITQVREKDCLIWRYANDFSALARFFRPPQQNMAGGPLSKPLAQLTTRDLHHLIGPYLRTGTTLAFFLFYLPTTLMIIFQITAALNGIRGVQDSYSGLGIRMPQIVPSWMLLSVGACVVALCIAPMAAWIAYARRVLNWAKFVLAVFGAYLVPTVALAVLALVSQRLEITWMTAMMKQLVAMF